MLQLVTQYCGHFFENGLQFAHCTLVSAHCNCEIRTRASQPNAQSWYLLLFHPVDFICSTVQPINPTSVQWRKIIEKHNKTPNKNDQKILYSMLFDLFNQPNVLICCRNYVLFEAKYILSKINKDSKIRLRNRPAMSQNKICITGCHFTIQSYHCQKFELVEVTFRSRLYKTNKTCPIQNAIRDSSNSSACT